MEVEKIVNLESGGSCRGVILREMEVWCVCGVWCVVCVGVCVCVWVFFLLHSMPHYTVILHALHNLRFTYQSFQV